ncbi:MAG: transposase [Hyphomicrobiaceae bacterium]
MSGHDASRPGFDLIAATRRRWTRAQKVAILAEIDAPGGSVSDVARRYSLHTSLLFRWRRDLAVTRPASADVAAPPTFVPVALPAPEPRPAAAAPEPSPIEIGLADGRTVRVGMDVDTAALVRIVDALERKR